MFVVFLIFLGKIWYFLKNSAELYWNTIEIVVVVVVVLSTTNRDDRFRVKANEIVCSIIAMVKWLCQKITVCRLIDYYATRVYSCVWALVHILRGLPMESPHDVHHSTIDLDVFALNTRKIPESMFRPSKSPRCCNCASNLRCASNTVPWLFIVVHRFSMAFMVRSWYCNALQSCPRFY